MMCNMICVARQTECAGRMPEAAGIQTEGRDTDSGQRRSSPTGKAGPPEVDVYRNSGSPRPATDSTGTGPATTSTPAAASSAPEAIAEQYTTNRSSATPSQVTRFMRSQKHTRHGFVSVLFSTVQIATAHLAQANCSASFTAFASAVPVLNLTMIPFTSCISNLLMTYTLAIPLLLNL